MAGFKIEQCDPSEYEDTINEFWEKYLPATGQNRLQWLQNNPAGETIWLMAFDSEGNEVLGTITVMLRDLYLNGRQIKAGAFGDLMVSEKCRVFGPALPLMRAAVEIGERNNIDLLYTVPNPSSLKLTERIGFEKKITLKNLVRPVRTKAYLDKKLKIAFLSTMLSILTDKVINLVPCLTLLLTGRKIQLHEQLDEQFDRFIEKYEKQLAVAGSVRSREFLTWRYINNPKYNFKVLSMSDKEGICGYISFCEKNNKILIYDLVYFSNKVLRTMINSLICYASRKNMQAIYFSVTSASDLPGKLKKRLFIDANADVDVMFRSDNEFNDIEEWIMFDGDRNI